MIILSIFLIAIHDNLEKSPEEHLDEMRTREYERRKLASRNNHYTILSNE